MASKGSKQAQERQFDGLKQSPCASALSLLHFETCCSQALKQFRRSAGSRPHRYVAVRVSSFDIRLVL